FIHNYSSNSEPSVYNLNDGKKAQQYGVILNNNGVKNLLVSDNMGTKELFTLKTEKGHELNAWIIKPKDFDAKKKYPVLLYQYSGPGSQEVTNSWIDINDQWHFM